MSLTGHNVRRRMAYRREQMNKQPQEEVEVKMQEAQVEEQEPDAEVEFNEKPLKDMTKPELVERYDFLSIAMPKAEMIAKIQSYIEG